MSPETNDRRRVGSIAAESKLARGDAAELMAAAKHLAEGCHGELEVLREGQGEEAEEQGGGAEHG